MISGGYFLAGVLCTAVCFCSAAREAAVWWSDFVARARTPESLRAAVEVTPTDAAKWRQLGIALLPSQPEAAADAFRRAVRLTSFEPEALIGLGMIAEASKDRRTAEQAYVRAAETSRRFKPQYALAAFYSRADRMPEFRRTASAAAAIDGADIGRLVQLAIDTGTAIDDIPSALNLRTEHALSSFLRIAIAENRPKAIDHAATLLPITARNRPVLLEACDLLIRAGAVDDAVRVWNRVSFAGKLEPRAGKSLTDGNFRSDEAGGFHWKYTSAPGASARATNSGVRLELSGEQPEHLVLAEQTAPVLGGRRYKLAVRSEATEGASGLQWHLGCTRPEEQIASAEVVDATELAFDTPAGCSLARIMLRYDRRPGTVRMAGTLDLFSASLELLP